MKKESLDTIYFAFLKKTVTDDLDLNLKRINTAKKKMTMFKKDGSRLIKRVGFLLQANEYISF